MTSKTTGYRYDFDALRAVMMLLGIFYHASLIYGFEQFDLKDANPSFLLEAISTLIHSFRMQVFFALGGYFCAVSLARHGALESMRRRVMRIGLPFCSSLILINTLEWYVTCGIHPFWTALHSSLYRAAWKSGSILFHLWFLEVLLFCNFVHLLTYRYHQPLLRLVRRCPSWVIALLVTGGGVLGTAVSNRFIPADVSGALYIWPGWYRILSYLPYYCFGLLIFEYTDGAMERFSFREALGLGSSGVLAAWAPILHPSLNRHAVNLSERFSMAILGWIILKFCFEMSPRIWRLLPRVLQYLAGASYPIYLVHQLAVVLIGYQLRNWGSPVIVKWAVVSAATMGLSVLIYHLVLRRVSALRFLFTGTPIPRVRLASAAGAQP